MRANILAAAVAMIMGAGGPMVQAQSMEYAAQVDWVRRPTSQDIARMYPLIAQQRGQEGNVIVECFVEPSGYLSRCHAVRESPEGVGFGPAAVALAQLFQARMPLDPANGDAQKVKFPIGFRLPRK